MSADSLEVALRAAGIACLVRDHERVALLVPDRSGPPVDWRAERGRATRLARAHGFTHVAIELPEPSGAPVHRDQR